LSHSETQRFIFKRVSEEVGDDQHAILGLNKISRHKRLYTPYRDKLTVQHACWQRGKVYHASLLAGDALKRRTSISERFDDNPMQFSVVQQSKEERIKDEQ